MQLGINQLNTPVDSTGQTSAQADSIQPEHLTLNVQREQQRKHVRMAATHLCSAIYK